MKNSSAFKVFKIKVVAAILLSLAIVSCHEVTRVKKPDKMIPDKTLVSILTETTIADGLLTLPDVKDKFTDRDSLSVYAKIVKRYGYTWEEMDNTMNYLFAKKQKRLLKIYDKVLEKITELQTRINNEPIPDAIPESDIWKGPRSIYFPDPLSPGDGDFSFRLMNPGFFSITYNMTLYPDDQSLNPCVTVWYVNADSAETGKRKYFKSQKYFPDGSTRAYSISGKIDAPGPVLIQGKLFDRENLLDEGQKHARIDRIFFTFTRQAL